MARQSSLVVWRVERNSYLNAYAVGEDWVWRGEAPRDADRSEPVATILKSAADLCEYGWTQHESACDGNGQPVLPAHYNARCWCATGAINCVLSDIDTGECKRVWANAAFAILARTILEVGFTLPEYFPPVLLSMPADDLIVEWNDHSRRTQAQVVATLRIAAGSAS